MRETAGHKRRGSLLVSTLLLFSVLLTLGLALMSSQSSRMRSARAQVASLQAQQLALAGWEDFRLKLVKDRFFLDVAEEQPFFAYSEDVYRPSVAPAVPTQPPKEDLFGSYTVICDLTHLQREPKEGYLVVTVTGKVGIRQDRPAAERRMKFEIDYLTQQVVRVSDDGSL